MNETEALQNLYLELRLEKWGEALTGQTPGIEFDLHKAERHIPRTELTAAYAIRDKFRDVLSYVESENRWYLWDGRVHAPCDGDGVAIKVVKYFWTAMRDALQVAKSHNETLASLAASSGSATAKEDAAKIRDQYNKGEISKHKKFRDRLAAEAGISAVVRMLKTELDVSASHFEDDRQWLSVRNGVIDLHAYRATGKLELLEHDASRPVTRYFDADYDPAAGADTWKAFLASSIVDDGGDTVNLVQKAVGAAFSAEEKPRALFNLLGAPASGKSVFLSVFNKLGQGYSVMPNNQAIQLNNGDTNFYQDALRGARFVGFSEVQGKKPLDDGFLKGVLGGDQQETRQMRQTPKVWKPQCVLFIASNMPLKFNTRDEATFIKILPIPFPHSFTTTDPMHLMDRELESKVLLERSGILSWVLDGMAAFWREGLDPTEAVLRAMDGNKTANSHALRFMEAMLESGLLTQNLDAPATACFPIGTAYDVFKSWTMQEGISRVPGKHMFTSDIADFYHGKSKGKSWIFTGLEMSPRVHQKVDSKLDLYTLASEL